MTAEVQDINDIKWEAQFDRLKDYMKVNENRIPYPRKGQDAEIESIGQWVSKQRKLYRGPGLDKARQQRLLEVPGILVARQYETYAGMFPEKNRVESIRTELHEAFRDSNDDDAPYTVESAIKVVDDTLDKLLVS